MSSFIPWMAAEGERPEENVAPEFPTEGTEEHRGSHDPHLFDCRSLPSGPRSVSAKNAETKVGQPGLDLPAHQFPGKKVDAVDAAESGGASESQIPCPVESGVERAESEFTTEEHGGDRGLPEVQNPAEADPWWVEDPEEARRRRVYRGRTVGMLRRYMRYSMETGRLPSLLGREFFRAKVTSYTVVTFEDRVIFVHDMEICLARLDEFSRQLIARHILQEHDRWATAKLLHCNEKTVRRLTPLVLDTLSEILLEVGLMDRLDSDAKKSCQGGLEDEKSASDCEESENKF